MDMKTCNFCNETKNIDDFYKSQSGKKCISCFLKFGKEYKKRKRENVEFRKLEGLKQKERRVRLWQNTLINDSRYRGIKNDLTVDDINEIFEKQNGLCYWFKIPLIPSNKHKHPQQPSLDRLDRNQGYIKENVVLTCYSANIGRNETDIETWTDFIKLFVK